MRLNLPPAWLSSLLDAAMKPLSHVWHSKEQSVINPGFPSKIKKEEGSQRPPLRQGKL